MKTCPKCFKEHIKNGTYCSYACANSRKWSDADKHKICLSLHKYHGTQYIVKPQKIAQHKFSDEDVFVENSSYARHHIKRRILKDKKIPYICSDCGLGNIWNDKEISLQLEHINGINDDNRLSNLTFLCPNCHSQTLTYAAKNRKNPVRKPKKYI